MAIRLETPRIEIVDYTPQDADRVFKFIDLNDETEALHARGFAARPDDFNLQIMLDWHGGQAFRIMSCVGLLKGKSKVSAPFAVFAIGHTGQSGVAQAALLAKHHFGFTRELAELVILIRHALPTIAADHNIHRIEVRSWANHPTAPNLLSALGFEKECTMLGFGATGMDEYHQYARLFPHINQKDQTHVYE